MKAGKTAYELTKILKEDKKGECLCICNNCLTVMSDKNPQFGAKRYDTKDIHVEDMQYYGGRIEDTNPDLIGAWVCPVCETDEYLMDL